MARDPKNPAGSLKTENAGGLLTGFLAEEDGLDRRSLWRLGSWGAGAVGAVIVALLANRFSIGMHHDQVAAADLLRQSQQIQSIARENQSEARRLASAIDTLNSDRDRLYSRVTVLEHGLESVTGAIARQTAAASVQAAPPPPAKAEPQSAAPSPPPALVVSPVATTTAPAEKPRAEAAAPEKAQATVAPVGQGTALAPTPATSLVASKSLMAPPDSAAGKLIEPAAPATATAAAPKPELPKPEVVALATPADEAESDLSQSLPKVAVQRTEFGVDVGGANSIPGLRALWRGLLKSRSNAPLTTLRPIIVIKEGSNGLGMQLRLVAGPFGDAAAAAKICAGMIENERPCATTVYDGQSLTMKPDETAATAVTTTKPVSARPISRRRSIPKRVVNNEPPKQPDPPPSTLSTLFGRR
jgi:hypothetical protein